MSTYDPLKTAEERAADYRQNMADTVARGDLMIGHTSPDTAFVVDDWPFGFRLRCQKRFWLEYKKNFGFRLVSQTTNPKRAGTVWNKPKAGTYHECAVMVHEDDEHRTIHLHTIEPGGWSKPETVDAFETHYAAALTPAHHDAIRYIRATNAASKYITVSIRTDTRPLPRTTEEREARAAEDAAHKAEQTRHLRAALAQGYRDTEPATTD